MISPPQIRVWGSFLLVVIFSVFSFTNHFGRVYYVVRGSVFTATISTVVVLVIFTVATYPRTIPSSLRYSFSFLHSFLDDPLFVSQNMESRVTISFFIFLVLPHTEELMHHAE